MPRLRSRSRDGRVARMQPPGWRGGSPGPLGRPDDCRGSASRERNHGVGDHPIPFRTRQLSPTSPKVLRREAAGGQVVPLAGGAFPSPPGPAPALRRRWRPGQRGRCRLRHPAGCLLLSGPRLRAARSPEGRDRRGLRPWGDAVIIDARPGVFCFSGLSFSSPSAVKWGRPLSTARGARV